MILCGADGCLKPAEKKCSRCNKVFYCSRECQVGAWKLHKKSCQYRRSFSVLCPLAVLDEADNTRFRRFLHSLASQSDRNFDVHFVFGRVENDEAQHALAAQAEQDVAAILGPDVKVCIASTSLETPNMTRNELHVVWLEHFMQVVEETMNDNCFLTFSDPFSVLHPHYVRFAREQLSLHHQDDDFGLCLFSKYHVEEVPDDFDATMEMIKEITSTQLENDVTFWQANIGEHSNFFDWVFSSSMLSACFDLSDVSDAYVMFAHCFQFECENPLFIAHTEWLTLYDMSAADTHRTANALDIGKPLGLEIDPQLFSSFRGPIQTYLECESALRRALGATYEERREPVMGQICRRWMLEEFKKELINRKLEQHGLRTIIKHITDGTQHSSISAEHWTEVLQAWTKLQENVASIRAFWEKSLYNHLMQDWPSEDEEDEEDFADHGGYKGYDDYDDYDDEY